MAYIIEVVPIRQHPQRHYYSFQAQSEHLSNSNSQLFDMLWRKAIPAKQRMKEIEEGIKRAFIETIQDSDETLSLVSKVLSFANEEEILIIFSNISTIGQFKKHGVIDLLKSKAKQEINVRVLMDTNTSRREKNCLKGINI